MSGGSYDYAYAKLDELRRWPSILSSMASRCREWAASEQAATRYDRSLRKDVPSTLEDRACIMVRALLLDRAASRLGAVIAEVEGLEDIMHDVEWVASGDSGVDSLMGRLEVP